MTFQTDKVDQGYLPFYLGEFSGYAHLGLLRPAIVELGVAHGAGLDMIRTLCPQAYLIGVDISAGAEAYCTSAGADFVHLDQADDKLPDRIERLIDRQRDSGPIELTMVIDDASHQGGKTFASLTRLFPVLVTGGTYVIEDWFVGFGTHPEYDDSMRRLAEDLLPAFASPPAPRPDPRDMYENISRIELSYGLMAIRKR